MKTEETGPERPIITYAATVYEDRSITIAAGLAAVMEEHKDASEHDKKCALHWFKSKYIET